MFFKQRLRRIIPFFTMSLILISSTLSAHGPTRQKVTETIEVEASAEAVWDVIKDFADAAQWHPMVESSSSDGGNEPGAIRELTLGPDKIIYEKLKKYNPEKMLYSYRIPADTHDINILPVTNYSSTISVKHNGDNSIVTWKGAFYRGYPNNDPPAELNDEAAVAAVTAVYKAGLSNLKLLVESKN